MSAHTPGPWLQNDGEVWAANHGPVSRIYCGLPDGPGAANARLIAAAPCLLAALQALVMRVQRGYDGLPQGEGLRMAEAAIAKATGAE